MSEDAIRLKMDALPGGSCCLVKVTGGNKEERDRVINSINHVFGRRLSLLWCTPDHGADIDFDVTVHVKP